MAEAQWESFFTEAFGDIKKELTNHYRLKTDGSGRPDFVAIRKGIEQFPPSVKMLELKVDRNKFKHLIDDYCPILSYDFESAKFSVKHFGKVDSSDPKFLQILKDEFGIEDSDFVKRFSQDFNITALYGNLSSHLQFLFYDPRKDPDQFVSDFIHVLFDSYFAKQFVKKFDTTPDFNNMYSLKPDAIIPEQELLRKYGHMGAFAKIDRNGVRKITLSDLQEDMVDVHLIPKVNEHVMKVFDRAKRLYVFGWYVYDFFPIANHYAALALESAIKHRYYAHFGRNVKIRNKKGLEAVLPEIDHDRIIRFCDDNDGWDRNHIEIEGEKFLYRMSDILEWLVKNKIITIWDMTMCRYIIDVRNYLSHQTFAPTYPSGHPYRTIKQVAFLINKMFHN